MLTKVDQVNKKNLLKLLLTMIKIIILMINSMKVE